MRLKQPSTEPNILRSVDGIDSHGFSLTRKYVEICPDCITVSFRLSTLYENNENRTMRALSGNPFFHRMILFQHYMPVSKMPTCTHPHRAGYSIESDSTANNALNASRWYSTGMPASSWNTRQAANTCLTGMRSIVLIQERAFCHSSMN